MKKYTQTIELALMSAVFTTFIGLFVGLNLMPH
jgi:hypothetical protein